MSSDNTFYLEKIGDAWEKLADSGDIEESIRDNIKESWNRCMNFDILPARSQTHERGFLKETFTEILFCITQ